MNLETFWLLGLLAIGVCTFLISKSMHSVHPANGVRAVEITMYWGIVLEIVWVVFGLILWLITKAEQLS